MTSPQAYDLSSTDEIQRQEAGNCDRHGEFIQRVTEFAGVEHRSFCPVCADERKAERVLQESAALAKAHEYRVADLRAESGIPLRYEGCTLEDYASSNRGQKMALSICRRYVEDWNTHWDDGRCMVFVGGPGTGKTHLACAIGSAVIESHERTVRFATASGMLREIRSTYRRGSERSEADAVELFTRCDLLILDEIGVQLGSEYEKTIMFEVLNERYQSILPTILVSNLSADDLEGYLGHRLMDRLRETGVVVAFGWDSYRGRQSA